MENLRTLIFFLPFLFNQIWAFIPTDNYLLDCGSSVTTTINNRNFIGDSSELRHISVPGIRSISVTHPNPSSSSPLYNTARVFTKPSNYIFKINKRGTHLVRLHFLPFQSDHFNLSNALFHVSANRILLLKDFSPKNENNLIKEYSIWVDTEEELVISFIPHQLSSFAFVNAIEVFSAPDDLIADSAQNVSYKRGDMTDVYVSGLKHQAMETVYRINVGGPKVTPFNDSLWRTWIPDDGFFATNPDSKVVHFTGPIKYRKGGLSREIGPDNVYNSARVINSTANMTWGFEVSSRYRYLVRMHFCDIASMVLNRLYFNVYVNGYLAIEGLDLSSIDRVLAFPYYVDFVVDAGDSELISVSVGYWKFGGDGEVKAILNGLEIMKMSNCMGSLDGEMSLDMIIKNSSRGHMGVLGPSIAVMSLVIVGLVFVNKKKGLVKDSVGWSRLPVDPPKG